MYDDYFTFRSLTAAQRAVQCLERAGIPVQLARTPKQLERMGCGYCVRVQTSQGQLARWELERNQVFYNKIYHRYADGSWGESAE